MSPHWLIPIRTIFDESTKLRLDASDIIVFRSSISVKMDIDVVEPSLSDLGPHPL
jgi:hypothetical protein